MRKLLWLNCVLALTALAATAYLFWSERASSAATSPMGALVDGFTCPPGHTRIALTRGIEDGFAATGSEPSAMSPRLLRNGYYADLAEGRVSAAQLRAYDQGGVDRVLMDHFDVPGSIASGSVVVRVASGGIGSGNDSVLLGDLDALATPDQLNSGRTYTARFSEQAAVTTTLADGSSLIAIPLERIALSGISPRAGRTALEYLKQPGHPRDVDVLIGDDTKVDALALLACAMPTQARGTTFAEHRLKPMGEDVSWMGCMIDHSQRGCDPLAGDRLCSQPGPVACYHDGARTQPPKLVEIGLAETAFVGGEIRQTAPVRGDQFARLADADRYCAASFGAGWRVLSYHEGGGGQVVSYSAIAPRSRALVNIRDQQYANCWDRDVKR